MLAHISDTHDNVDYLKAMGIITNHLSSKYSVECPVLHSGDYEASLLEKINEEIGEYDNEFISCLGNHDPDETPEKLTNAKFPDLVYRAGGKKIVSIKQHWENSLKGINLYDQNNYGDLEERLDEIEEELEDADVVIMHEGAHDGIAVKEGNYHKKLGEIIKKRGEKGKELILQCGHAHETKYEKLEDNLFGIRPYGQKDKGAAYITIGNSVYKVDNSKVYEWAKDIDESYERSEPIEPNSKEIPDEGIHTEEVQGPNGPINVIYRNKTSDQMIPALFEKDEIQVAKIQNGKEVYIVDEEELKKRYMQVVEQQRSGNFGKEQPEEPQESKEPIEMPQESMEPNPEEQQAA